MEFRGENDWRQAGNMSMCPRVTTDTFHYKKHCASSPRKKSSLISNRSSECVIDQRVSTCGARNVIDEYACGTGENPRSSGEKKIGHVGFEKWIGGRKVGER